MAETGNPYYDYFCRAYGAGGNTAYPGGIGDVYNSVPQFKRGYGIRTRRSLVPLRPRLGYGWSSWWSNMIKFAKPLFKRGLKEVAQPLMSRGLQEVADVAGKVAADTLQGSTFKESLKKRTNEKAAELVEKVPNAFSGVIRKSKGAGLRSRSVHARNIGVNSSSTSEVFRPKKVKKKAGRKRKLSQEHIYPGLKLLQ
jgi:hypothetical protein